MATDYLTVAGVAVAAFASTNVDNLLMSGAMVAAAKPNRVRRILVGQVLSAVAVVGLAGGAAIVLSAFSARLIGLLGLVPLALGVRALAALRDPEVRSGRAKHPLAGGFFLSLLIGFGSSGDNLAVYIPLLRAGGTGSGLATVGVFAVLEALLIVVAVGAGRHPATLRVLDRGGVFVTPVLYVAIGVIILLRAGTISG